MSHPVHHIPCVLPTKSIDKGVESHRLQRYRYVPFAGTGWLLGSQQNTTAPAIVQLIQHSTPIDVLDDDCLLNTFRLCRPPLLNGDEDHNDRILWGPAWNSERWWYKLTHVCRRWRHLILGYASHLGICLLCAPGTPVADMLAHSPPFPIVIDHFHTNHGDHMTANDVEGIILALEHRNRVRRIRLRTSFLMMEKVSIPMDGEFPMLEFLCIEPLQNMNFQFPKTFQVPQLRHLILTNFTCPIGSPLLSAAMGLVGLSLVNIPPSTYFQPEELLHRVSHMPQLESLWIGFALIHPRHDVDLRVIHMDNATHITLPHLRFFQFRGSNAYSEALLSRITAPRLEAVRIAFWEERAFSVPCLLQFMSTSQYLRLGSAVLSFNVVGAMLSLHPHWKVKVSVFDMFVEDRPEHRVSNAAQILNALSPLFSSVVELLLDYRDNQSSPELQNEAEPTNWRLLLRSFNNLKTLFVASSVVEKLSRSLLLDDGEPPDDLLPELKELAYSPSDANADAFTGFIDARQNAGHPVTLVHLKAAVSNPFFGPGS